MESECPAVRRRITRALMESTDGISTIVRSILGQRLKCEGWSVESWLERGGKKKKGKKERRGKKSPCSLKSKGIDAVQWWGCRGNSSQSLLSWLAGIVKMAQVMCCVQLFRGSYRTVRDLARPIIQGTKAVLLDMDYCNCISSPLCEY